MQQGRRRRRIPIAHIVVVAAGWALYAWKLNWGTLVLAAVLSILTIVRLVRGPLELTEARVARQLRRPPRPSKRIARLLLDGETLLSETHQHPISLMLWWIGGLLASALAVVVGLKSSWTAAGIVWGVGVLPVLFKVVQWRHDKLCLTDRRIFVLRGFTHVRLEWMPISKLTNETLQTPWHSNLLAWLRLVQTPYGTISVDAAGEEDELKRISFVPNAIQVNLLIMETAMT